jgi:pimeloyl-ACP methyl ester carboxylesterase
VPDDINSAALAGARTEKAYPKLIYYNRLDKGGHLAAWEQPELFTRELRAAFRSLRKTPR